MAGAHHKSVHSHSTRADGDGDPMLAKMQETKPMLKLASTLEVQNEAQNGAECGAQATGCRDEAG